MDRQRNFFCKSLIVPLILLAICTQIQSHAAERGNEKIVSERFIEKALVLQAEMKKAIENNSMSTAALGHAAAIQRALELGKLTEAEFELNEALKSLQINPDHLPVTAKKIDPKLKEILEKVQAMSLDPKHSKTLADINRNIALGNLDEAQRLLETVMK